MAPTARRSVVLLLSFCAAGVLSVACGEQEYPTTAFVCDPSAADSCPKSHLCCSTDPSALDLDDLNTPALPDYVAGGSGLPVFSGLENGSGRYGRCVEISAIDTIAVLGDDEGAAAGCPLPCNPRWESADIDTVCGADAFCCPTQELGELDCGFDPDLGTSGCWRPVTGTDINSLGGLNISDWGSADHDTHQDPAGVGCGDFAEGIDPADLSAAGVSQDDVLRACYRNLSVAAQRGLCTAANGESSAAAVCPLSDPAHRDACELKNDDEGRGGCEAVEFP